MLTVVIAGSMVPFNEQILPTDNRLVFIKYEKGQYSLLEAFFLHARMLSDLKPES